MAGRVVVVGSLNEDQTLLVEAIPRPGETVLSHRTQRSCGGKGANQAVAAARAGAAVAMIGTVGADDAGRRLYGALRAEGIDVSRLAAGDEPTGLAVVVVERTGENAIVVAPGANASVTSHQVDEALRDLGSEDVVVVQGEIPVPAILAALNSTLAMSVLNLAPPVDIDLDRVRVDVLVVNEHEAAAVAGPDAPSDPEQLGTALARHTDGAVVITLGGNGTVLATPTETMRIDPYPAAEVIDTTGAGDAFVGAFAAALAAGRPVAEAVRWGAAAGSIAVGATGAQGGRATPDAIQQVIGSTA